nr:transposase family protein [Streptomyces sp. SID4946]
MVCIDRLLATLAHLHHGTTHDVLLCWFGVDCSAITRAVGEGQRLRAGRGAPSARRSAADLGRGRRPSHRQ